MKRHFISLSIVSLFVVSSIIAYSSTDPGRGDLQISNYESAAQRIFPPDLVKMKEYLMFVMTISPHVKERVMKQLNVTSRSELSLVQPQKFFPVLIRLIREQNPEFTGFYLKARVTDITKVMKERGVRLLVTLEINVGDRYKSAMIVQDLVLEGGKWYVRLGAL
ncbi:MAG: hypothetical protein FJ088_03645 [Deltaproteobacteria bacterium]|nr:hypothetical protein [Deltaproteobacteria bacterium]